MTRREYLIGPEFDLPKVIAQAEKLAARAQKKGLSGGYKISYETRILPSDDGQPKQAQFLIIDGEPIRYSGWQFVAKCEYVNGQPVVSGSSWYDGPQVDRSALRPNACDHCGISIARKHTIIVENEAGDRKQVGTSCVADFLGAEVKGSWYSDRDPFDELDGYRGSGCVSLESLSQTLAQAASVIRQSGWVPGWKADYEQTTAQVVRLLKGWGSAQYVKEIQAQYGDPTDDDYAVAGRALQWGKNIEGDSDYAANVRAIFATDDDWFDPKFIGIVVSVPAMMLKAEGELAAKEKAPDIIEEVFAEPKTKIEVADAVVTDVIGFDSQWGSGQIIVIVGQGYRFKWTTSSYPGLNVGDVIDFKASVKGKDEYNGKVSTQVLRVKFAAA